jgi:signal transduction histidine kinase
VRHERPTPAGAQTDSEIQGMSTAQDRRVALTASADAVRMALDGVVRAPAPSPRRRRERRRIGLHSIGRRTIDGQRASEVSLAQERQRVAAQLHDLVLQDVSFALARARSIAADPSLAPRHAESAVAAGERALAGARAILASLSGRQHAPVLELFETGVRASARDVRLFLELPDEAGAEPDQPTADALVHIGREAVTNAVKHAVPTLIEVSLAREDEWRLTICDNGSGFEAVDVEAGFGLDSLRRSAEELGGSFSITSAPSRGTRIEVTLP